MGTDVVGHPPGVYYGMTMQEYLDLPAVSSGVLTAMVDECPFAGWFASHLNHNREPDNTSASDVGSVAHAVLLEGSESCVAEINPNDHPAEKGGGIPVGWTNKSIRAARDQARAEGKIPILAADMFEIRQMVRVAQLYIESLKSSEPDIHAMFQPSGGMSEVTLVWQEGHTLCKARPDRLSKGEGILLNYKTTAGSVEPSRWARTQLLDYYVGAALYVRACRSLFGAEPPYLYLVQQSVKPYLCSLVGLDPHWIDLGNRKVDAALAQWDMCVQRQSWPGYPNRVVWPEVMPWEETRWMEREAMLPLATRVELGSQG